MTNLRDIFILFQKMTFRKYLLAKNDKVHILDDTHKINQEVIKVYNSIIRLSA